MQLQKFLSPLRRAVEDYHMIREGDCVAVGVSGGKDSLALLLGLATLAKFYPHKFRVIAITIDMGFENSDFSKIAAVCREIEVPYYIEKTDIKSVVFDIRKEKNPCSLCAKMRRGALHGAAQKYGANKVALGHHSDDVVETFYLSLFYEGRISCFSPVTYLPERDLTMIRPMIYIKEADIKGLMKTEHLPVQKSACPADGGTKRAQIKAWLRNLNVDYKNVKQKTFTAIQNSRIPGWIDLD